MTRSVVIGGYDIAIPAGRDPSSITTAEAAEIRREQIMARAEAMRRECGEPAGSPARLRTVRWRCFGMRDEAQMRERAEFMAWLQGRGARVAAWMLEWGVRW